MLDSCCRDAGENDDDSIEVCTSARAEVAPHRGFNLKAREVLLEPMPPFAVTAKDSVHEGDSTHNSNAVKRHRGFSAKAKGVLIERDFASSYPVRYDGRVCKSKGETGRERTNAQESKISCSDVSINLIQMNPVSTKGFEETAEYTHSKASRVKARVLLGDIGKTRSAIDLFQKQRKDRPLFKVYQQDDMI